MSPQVSDLKCQCGRNAMEWIRYNQKNPDRRFIRCPDPVFNSEDGTSTFGIFLRKMGPKLL
ncbi:hypothetical protein Leryth_012794 [Lithospermum erythrorhizon]|nr:hypothetical protein Leryth_012794 [Lithospermum erythrorhizon]